MRRIMEVSRKNNPLSFRLLTELMQYDIRDGVCCLIHKLQSLRCLSHLCQIIPYFRLFPLQMIMHISSQAFNMPPQIMPNSSKLSKGRRKSVSGTR